MKKPMVIIVGPSGVGKSTFVNRLISEIDLFVDIVTFTTRALREGESEGSPYHFVSMEKFETLKQQNFFVEWAQVHGRCYGTPRDQLEKAWQQGRAVVLDVDVQGAQQIKSQYPQALTLFILPPSIDSLRYRIAKREGTTVDVDLRMKNAEYEISLASTFDFQVVNDDFEGSYREFKKIIEDYLKKD